MPQLVIRFNPRASQDTCGLCGRHMGTPAGPWLFLAERVQGVCESCAKKHEPSLAALLHLARVAERVGRIERHTLVPSLGHLLTLAHAAENYAHARPRAKRRVA